MNLKEIRKAKKLTQTQAAQICKISIRSYKSYENDLNKENTIKYTYLVDTLSNFNVIDEEHGVLTLIDIKTACENIFKNYDVSYCYLFGSYAKETAVDTSDVDLLIGSSVKGIQFYSLVEELRQSLKKKVDVLSIEQLYNNLELTNEVLKDGIKIYGKQKE